LENQGNYSLTLIADSLHCSFETDSINIQILPLPEIQILASSTNYCEGEYLELSTNNSSTNQIWNYPNGTEIVSQSLIITNLSLSDSGLYQIKLTSLGCTGIDSINISISPKPETPFLELISGNCIDDTLILLASGFEIQQGDLLVWQNNLGQNFETNSPELIIYPNSNLAEYYSTFLSRNNCSSETDTLFLFPQINLTYNYIDSLDYCPGNEIGLNPIISPINQINNYWWISPKGDTLGTSLNINFTPNSSENGDYKLIVIDTSNCKHIYDIHLSSDDCNQSAIPNSFTPNGDGYNDIWTWGFDSATHLSVSLFNRWGSNVTNLTGNTIHWNGENANGEALPSGTYYYVIKWLLNGQVNETKGYVDIKR
jgi:gliding motility-associated-like protein